MKIKPEHVAHMRGAIAADSRAPTWDQYKRAGLSATRWRWDLARRAGLIPFFCSTIYAYANDTHIDTALRHILPVQP